VSGALSSLMIITAVTLILPTALYSAFESTAPLDLEKQILAFSRGTAAVLFVLYIAYLNFSFGTHKELFDPKLETNQSAASNGAGDSNVLIEQETRQATQDIERDTHGDTERDAGPDAPQDLEQAPPSSSSHLAAFTALVCAAAGIMFCANFLLDSIDATSEATHITRTFIATIVIPIASNAPECATVLSCHTVDFAVGVIVGSILQIALFVIPALVMLGWAVNQPMTLNFETFQTIILFLAILLVNHLLQNGRYTYMHGLMLVGL
jgi:Ca2+:H+ antiporter